MAVVIDFKTRKILTNKAVQHPKITMILKDGEYLFDHNLGCDLECIALVEDALETWAEALFYDDD